MVRILVICFILFQLNSHGQQEFNVFDWKAEASVNIHFLQLMHEQYDERRQNFNKAVQSKNSTRQYALAIRNRFKLLIGDMPEKSPLNPKITGRFQSGNYTIEKVIYESYPGHHVTSNLYLPKSAEKLPAVIIFCGHEDISKATPSYQATARLFAEHGYVVLVVDPISQGERYQLTDGRGKGLTRGSTTEHTILNALSNLVGTSTAAYELWDNIRSLDYLFSRPEVDTTRVGCLGNSGGAMQTIYFAAYDNRVKVIAPSSYLASRERTFDLTGAADGCAHIPGEGKALLEMSDLLISAAPTPLLVIAGKYDFIDYQATLNAHDDLKQIYRSFGKADHLSLFTFDDGHGISRPKREAVLSWFNKWLKKDNRRAVETDTMVHTVKELNATTTGQVDTEFASEQSIWQTNLNLFDTLQSSRDKFISQTPYVIRKKLSELLLLPASFLPAKIERKATRYVSNIPFVPGILRRDGQMPIPFLRIENNRKPSKIIVWLHDHGKSFLKDSAQLIQSYLEEGSIIIAADLSGMGETSDRLALNDPKYYNDEYRNVMLSLHIGRPLVGQRVTDILSIVEYVRSETGFSQLPIEIHAAGNAAIPALHAAVINGRITHLALYRTIQSYKQVLIDPLQRNWYSIVIPGVLKYYDLPDLVRFLEPGSVKFVQ